jgi:hypothetical protein
VVGNLSEFESRIPGHALGPRDEVTEHVLLPVAAIRLTAAAKARVSAPRTAGSPECWMAAWAGPE